MRYRFVMNRYIALTSKNITDFGRICIVGKSKAARLQNKLTSTNLVLTKYRKFRTWPTIVCSTFSLENLLCKLGCQVKLHLFLALHLNWYYHLKKKRKKRRRRSILVSVMFKTKNILFSMNQSIQNWVEKLRCWSHKCIYSHLKFEHKT